MPRTRTKPRTIDFLVAVNQRLWKDIKYLIRLEPGVQTPEETLEKMSGSCRDSAWLLCQLFRHCGLAARFVCGYLIQLKPDVKSLDGPSGAEKDFTDLHAWTEVYLPGAGWIGLDPTSGLLAGEGHIPLACTPDPSSAAPITGAVDECECEFSFEMNVTRVHESPRVTMPYTEEQWEEIESLGHAIDADLKKGDVRLTMGGEPTFVSIDDPDGAEWNFTAVSHKKTHSVRRTHQAAARKIRARLAAALRPGQMVSGRTAAALGARGVLAQGRRAGLEGRFAHRRRIEELRPRREGSEGIVVAHRHDRRRRSEAFDSGLRGRVLLHLEGTPLPVNVTPEKSNLKDKLERDRIARIFQQGLGSVVGYALPINALVATGGWMSGAWFLRDDDTLWLIPGDSPMGLRLPLDSIPWVAEKDFPWLRQQDPSQPKLPELPKEFPYRAAGFVGSDFADGAPTLPGQGRGQRAQKLGEKAKPLEPLPPDENPTAPARRRARARRGSSARRLCVEPRDGRLHVFMPPVEHDGRLSRSDRRHRNRRHRNGHAGHHRRRNAAARSAPEQARRHARSRRHRGQHASRAKPGTNWSSARRCFTRKRARRGWARKNSCSTAATPARAAATTSSSAAEAPPDSPVLRRPDLLRSLLAYWQNHPSLSWLFSGLFIGPTSQAPRIDEARNDSLYELEVAFKELDRRSRAFG